MYINIGDQRANVLETITLAEQSANVPGIISTGKQSANVTSNNTTEGSNGTFSDLH